MTAVELVDRLKESRQRADAIARILGYVVMIQRLGWDGLPLSRSGRYKIEKLFAFLGVDPLSVEL